MNKEYLLNYMHVNQGCDPELFFVRGGRVIGSEMVIGNGLTPPPGVVEDGVQVELHPAYSTCRQDLGRNIGSLFYLLREHLQKIPDVSLSFRDHVEMRDEDLEVLSEKARVLGCMRSLNAYGEKSPIVAGEVYRTRSAGGHIHLGYNGNTYWKEINQELYIRLLDVILGNTCVMFDRSEFAAERRKLYGRAGEYRTPSHGIEYRVLSNWWLHSYQTMSFVFGTARIASAIMGFRFYQDTLLKQFQMQKDQLLKQYPDAAKTYKDWITNHDKQIENAKRKLDIDYAKILLDGVDFDRIREAINTNNYDLARENYERYLKPFLREHVYMAGGNHCFSLGYNVLDQFDEVLDRVKEKGLKMINSRDPLIHWCNHYSVSRQPGWEMFLTDVRPRSKSKVA